MNMEFSKDISQLKEEMVSSELLYDGKVIRVFRDDVRLPDGKIAFREYNRHMGAVCVIPVTDDGDVICVRQYRYAVGDALLEIPAGKLDSREEIPAEAALRELREETGATCEKLTYLGKYLGSPAILDECIYMYMAEGLTFGDTDFDDDEFIETVRLPLAALVEMVERGEIPDGKTQAAALRAYLRREREKNI